MAADDVSPADPLLVSRTAARLTENGLYQAMRRAHAAGGGEGPIGLHAFRRLFAAFIKSAGVDERVTQDNRGHDDARTTALYAGATNLETARTALHGSTPLSLLKGGRSKRTKPKRPEITEAG